MYPIEKYKFVVYDKKNDDDTISKVVVAMSTYGGKTVKGTALCAATDEFDLEIGKKLAAARCDLKVCRRRARQAAKRQADVLRHFEAVQKNRDKMFNYYMNSLEEMLESAIRLRELEESLG